MLVSPDIPSSKAQAQKSQSQEVIAGANSWSVTIKRITTKIVPEAWVEYNVQFGLKLRKRRMGNGHSPTSMAFRPKEVNVLTIIPMSIPPRQNLLANTRTKQVLVFPFQQIPPVEHQLAKRISPILTIRVRTATNFDHPKIHQVTMALP